MSKKNNKNNEPPSLFDSFDLFADAAAATSKMPVVPVAGADARHPDKRDHPATGKMPVGLVAGETPATPTSL